MTSFDQQNQYVLNQYNAETISIHQKIFSRSEDATSLALAQERIAELPLDTIPEVTPLPLGSRMPLSPNYHFVGRKNNLQALAAAFKNGGTVMINHVGIAATTGMAGVGKTQLASEFVHRYGQYFAGGVFWFSFANSDTVSTEIADCIGMLDLQSHPELAKLSLDDRIRLVSSAWQSSMPRLLVFDECESEQLFEKWRPHTGGCRVLITSLRPNWSAELGIKVLSLDCLSREESTILLSKHREDIAANDPNFDAIANELGDLPLALHLVVRLLNV